MPYTYAGLLRDPVHLRSKQPVDKTDVEREKDTESHAGKTRNHGQVPVDIEESLSGVNHGN